MEDQTVVAHVRLPFLASPTSPLLAKGKVKLDILLERGRGGILSFCANFYWKRN